jgi:signal transduction histidine kinase
VSWLQRIAWAAVAVATLGIAVIPDLVSLPEPSGGIVLARATYLPDNGRGGHVALPHSFFPRFGQTPVLLRYDIDVELTPATDNDLFVYIPSVNRRVSLAFNGQHFLGFESSSIWTGPLISSSLMVRLPQSALASGHNRLTVTLDAANFVVPTYLSKIYIGSEKALVLPFKIRIFFESQLKTMALAVHIIMGIGLIVAYFFRPNDPLFRWLAVLNIVSLVVGAGAYVGWQPALQGVVPFTNILIPTLGFLFIGFALTVVDLRPPRVLAYATIGMPIALLPCAVIDTTLTKAILAAVVVSTLVVSYVSAVAFLIWGAFRRGNIDAQMILAPMFLVAWFSLRDVYVTLSAPAHGLNMLTGYGRPLLLAAVTAMLMRRMGISLEQLDRANETLNIKLAAREAELAELHRQERIEATRITREQERQRLTHDLHDGISGHLVSIIALSERAGDRQIEQAAREALNDLRLVIYSLDLGDRELPLALANFRERLVPQLQRLGVELDWSIAGLPEVSGITPGNALTILRILQEAITNALKHGPARKIVIRAGVAPGDTVAITIENDGRPFVEQPGGHGLANMRRRARHLNGELNVAASDRGSILTLLLPSRLPDFEEEASG